MLLRLFVVKFILVSFFFFFPCIMVLVPVKGIRLIVVMDDLDFGIKMLHLKQKCSIGMAPLIKSQI